MRFDYEKVLRRRVDTVADMVRLGERCSGRGQVADHRVRSGFIDQCAAGLGDGFTKESSIPVRFSFAASSALARQIENGAPADVFLSADLEWMDYLKARNLIQRDTRHDVIGNRLVLIAPADSKIDVNIAPHFPLAKALGAGRLATGDPIRCPSAATPRGFDHLRCLERRGGPPGARG